VPAKVSGPWRAANALLAGEHGESGETSEHAHDEIAHFAVNSAGQLLPPFQEAISSLDSAQARFLL
jgi:hypothetical protein